MSSERVERFVGLTRLRALAITLVFFYHYGLFAHPAWIERVGEFGWTGVDLFFVLSGFLIARQLFGDLSARGTFSLREFYFKRLLRILPAYLVVLACYFAFPSVRERGGLAPLWKFLTFTQNFGLDLQTSGSFSHAWSLCIEEQFYLLLPLVLLALLAGRAGRLSGWLLPMLFGIGLIARTLVYAIRLSGLRDSPSFDFEWYEWIYYPTWSRLDGLLVGIGIAAVHEHRPAWRDKLTPHGQLLLGVGVALWALTWWQFVEPTSATASVIAFPAIAIVYGLIVTASLSPSCVLSRRASRLTHWLATLSYSLYLTHKVCIHLAQRQLARLGIATDGHLMLVCCIAASLAGAVVLHLSIERPFLRWRDRVTARRGLSREAGPSARPSEVRGPQPTQGGAVGSRGSPWRET